MSGGSHNYLYRAEMPDIINRTADMLDMEKALIQEGYPDIARDVRRLIEYCLSAENTIGILFAKLEDVFHAIEWYHSADYGRDTLIDHLEAYRKAEHPAADVVEVVRCKDCEYCEERHYEENGEMPYIKFTCKWSSYSHSPNDFCSLGERKEK